MAESRLGRKLRAELSRLRSIPGQWNEEQAAEYMKLIEQYPEEDEDDMRYVGWTGSAAYQKMAKLIHEGKIAWP